MAGRAHLLDDAFHGLIDAVALELAFPDGDRGPPEFFELGDGAAVALDVAAELRSQNSVFRLGVDGLQCGQRCQKQPFTKIAILRPGEGDVRLAGSFFHCRR